MAENRLGTSFSQSRVECVVLEEAFSKPYVATLLLSCILISLALEYGSYARKYPGARTPRLRVPAPPEQCSPQHLSLILHTSDQQSS